MTWDDEDDFGRYEDGDDVGLFREIASDMAAALRENASVSRSMLKREIVPVAQWASDPYYSGGLCNAWPSVRRAVIEICSSAEEGGAGRIGGNKYSEAIIAGAIGRGKTVVSKYVALRMRYVHSCYANVGEALGQEVGENIVYLFISTDYQKAFAKPYTAFVQAVKSAQYFKDHCWPKNLDATRSADGIPEELNFPDGITAKPVVTTEKGVISHTVACAVVDEVEHMNVVSGSTRTRGIGSTYDQAEAVCGELLSRMDSRMMKAGKRLGMVVFTSSPKYPQSFLQARILNARAYGWSHVYIDEDTLWGAQRGVVDPETGRAVFSDETTEEGGFTVEIGDDTYLSRILGPDDKPREKARLLRVPVELRPRFDPKMGANLEEAIRDFGGIPMLSVSPLIEDRAGLAACVRRPDPTHKPECECDVCVLARHPFAREESFMPGEDFIPEYLCEQDSDTGSWWPRKNREAPRFVHIDGSFDTEGGDATGLVMLHPYGTSMERTVDRLGREVYQTVVLCHVDLVLRIRRDPNKPAIEWARFRDLLVDLRDTYHFDIVMVSMDKYQSRFFLQELQNTDGFEVDDKLSVDDKPLPYLMLRDSLAAKRVSMYEHKHLIRELQDLEFDRRARKIDHPKHSTKDISDSLCGAHYKAVTMYAEYGGYVEAPTLSSSPTASEHREIEADIARAGSANAMRGAPVFAGDLPSMTDSDIGGSFDSLPSFTE